MSRRRGSGAHSIGLYLAVTLITLTVWIVAEGQTLQRRAVEMTLELAASDSRAIEVTDEEWTGRLKVTFQGPAAAESQADALTGTALAIGPGLAGLPIEDGEHTVDLRSAVRELLGTRRAANAVVMVEPPTVTVRVTELERMVKPIELVLPDGIAAIGVALNPASAELSAPKGQLAVDAVPRIELSPADLAGVPRGEPVTLSDRPVLVQGSDAARVAPLRASVTLTLQVEAARATLASVPIAIQLPPGELSLWEVRVPDEDRVLRDVVISGPAPLVRAYESGERPLVAVVRLGFEDLERQIEVKRAEFLSLAPGVRVEVEDSQVRLEITPRSGG